jgi:hypothetical protein
MWCLSDDIVFSHTSHFASLEPSISMGRLWMIFNAPMRSLMRCDRSTYLVRYKHLLNLIEYWYETFTLFQIEIRCTTCLESDCYKLLLYLMEDCESLHTSTGFGRTLWRYLTLFHRKSDVFCQLWVMVHCYGVLHCSIKVGCILPTSILSCSTLRRDLCIVP